jgi:hypothetical protein
MLATLPKFPCSADKTPLTPNGFHDARSGVDDSAFPLVGIPTGKVSGVDVLDIDPDGVGWYKLNFDALPSTRAHETRRGLHLIFRHVEGLRCSTGRIAKGIDVKADGGYFIWWPREGLPFDDNPITEMPTWLVGLAMGSGGHKDRAHLSVHHDGVDTSMGWMLSGLDPIDYREHDDWFRLMADCHAAGVDREAFIEWSISDPRYADDAEVIGRRWDSLRIGDWGRRVDARLASLTDARYYRRSVRQPSPMPLGKCPVPVSGGSLSQGVSADPDAKYRFQRRISALLREVSKGDEPKLFWASSVMREIIAEGRLNPSIAVQLLVGAWPKKLKGVDVRRVIAAAFLCVEDKLNDKEPGDETT